METSVEPDAMSEDEVTEVEKTVPVKEANPNYNDRNTIKPVRRAKLIQPSGIGRGDRCDGLLTHRSYTTPRDTTRAQNTKAWFLASTPS
jgi:hypothetical protein